MVGERALWRAPAAMLERAGEETVRRAKEALAALVQARREAEARP